MPLAKIEVRGAFSIEVRDGLIEAVYEAQREALRVPVDDRHIRYLEYPAERFSVADPGASTVLVEITIFPGRSADAKRSLFASIARRFAALGVSPDDLIVVLHEPPLEDWGLHGVPATDVDLGFDLDV